MNQIRIQGVCTCVPQFSYEKDRRGRSVPTCRYILAVQRPKSSYSDYMYCVAFGERAMITFQRIKKGTTVFVQGHLHTEEGRDANSNTGHSITVEQSDYSKKKEEAIQQIQDAVKDLSDDQQSEIDSYIKQNIENIQKAESERTIESTLQETLDYIDQRSLSEKEEQRKETQTTETSSSSEREVTSSSVSEEDKYHILGEDYIYENNDYLPVINQSNWIYMSDEEKDDWLKKCTPVKEDSAHSITAICTDAYGYNKSWFLPCRLHKWITENNITATEGEYLAYGTYKPSKETFYLVLNDSNRTVTLVTYNKNSQDFSFEFAGMTESEVLEMKKMDANTSDTTGHQEDSNNTSDAGDAPLSESALNEMEKNAEQNQ